MITDKEFYRLMDGKTIYGDDLSDSEIVDWFRDEEYASFETHHGVDNSQYNRLNDYYVFSKLKDYSFTKCLSIGSADGAELMPISNRVADFIVIEPVEQWWGTRVGDVPAEYRKPSATGNIDIETSSIDLAIVFGALHHIPNVSHVVDELLRVLKKGGVLILREPVVAMGDWRKKRRGMTPRERGLPLEPLKNAVISSGGKIVNVQLYDCPITLKIAKLLRIEKPYNKLYTVMLDRFICKFLAWNRHYYPRNVLQKMAPSSAFIVATKS